MPCVTVVVSGVPYHVTLIELSYYLERLFGTNTEIGTFDIRDLPRTGKRQIALDFSCGFDAIAAQEQLDGYSYELSNGRKYTLCARITNKTELLRSESLSPVPSCDEPVAKDSTMALLPTFSDGAMYRAHAKLDAQLALLKKQKMIVQAERELLKEKRRLKREYAYKYDDSDDETKKRRRSGSHDLTPSSTDKTKSKEQLSKEMQPKSKMHILAEAKQMALKWAELLKEPGSGSKERRRSRERSRSQDRRLDLVSSSDKLHSVGYKPVSPERDMEEHRPKSRGLRERPHSPPGLSPGERSRSPVISRDLRAKLKVRRTKFSPRSPDTTREKRSGSKETSRDRRSRSRDRKARDMPSRHSGCRDVSSARVRSTSRSGEHGDYQSTLREYNRENRCWRYGSMQWDAVERYQPLAIMPRSPDRCQATVRVYRVPINYSEVDVHNETEHDFFSVKDVSPDNLSSISDSTPSSDTKKDIITDDLAVDIEKLKREIENRKKIQYSAITNSDANSQKTSECTNTKVEVENKSMFIEESVNSNFIPIKNLTEHQSTVNNENDNESEAIDKVVAKRKRKCASNIVKKAKTLSERIDLVSKDVRFLMHMVLDELVIRDKIHITENERNQLDDKLTVIIDERVKPLAVANECNLQVVMGYRELYTKESDTILVKKLLDVIRAKPNVTIVKHSSAEKPIEEGKGSSITYVDLCNDPDDSLTKDNNGTIVIHKDLPDTNATKAIEPVKNNETAIVVVNDDTTVNRNEQEVLEAPIVIDDTDTIMNKKLPERPRFVLVVKKLLKQMKPTIYNNSEANVNVKFLTKIKDVLRVLISDMLKGKGYMRKAAIMKLFRERYPRDNDVEFVKNIAKDIDDGKYDHVGDTSDFPPKDASYDDEVIFVPRRYETISIDSDEENEKSKVSINDSTSACSGGSKQDDNQIIPMCQNITSTDLQSINVTEDICDSTSETIEAAKVNDVTEPNETEFEEKDEGPVSSPIIGVSDEDSAHNVPIVQSSTLSLPFLEETEEYEIQNCLPAIPNRAMAQPIIKENTKVVVQKEVPTALDPMSLRITETKDNNVVQRNPPAIQDQSSSLPINDNDKNAVQNSVPNIRVSLPITKDNCTNAAQNKTTYNNSQDKNDSNAQMSLTLSEQNKTEKQTNEVVENNENDEEERLQDNLKVTAITILTSETELHTLANLIKTDSATENTIDNEKLIDHIKEEIDTADNNLNNNYNNLNDENQASEEVEKETPLVTAITISTSISELLSLKFGSNNESAVKDVEIKTENPEWTEENGFEYYEESVQNTEANDNNMTDKNKVECKKNIENNVTNENSSNSENNGTNTNPEMLLPNKIMNNDDDEEESIEAIMKCVESFVKDYSAGNHT